MHMKVRNERKNNPLGHLRRVDDESVPLEQLAFAPLTTLALADVALGAVALLLFVAALAAGVWCLADDDAPGDKARKWA